VIKGRNAATLGRRAGKERKTAPHYSPVNLVSTSWFTAVQEMKILIFTTAGRFVPVPSLVLLICPHG
jgi:hypothetical protein